MVISWKKGGAENIIDPSWIEKRMGNCIDDLSGQMQTLLEAILSDEQQRISAKAIVKRFITDAHAYAWNMFRNFEKDVGELSKLELLKK